MKNQDRSTKILLGLLVAGVWGLLLKPMVSTSVEAQPNSKTPIKSKRIDAQKVVMLSSEPYGNDKKVMADFVSEINAQEVQGYRIKGFQTVADRNGIFQHFAILERN